MTRGRRSGTTGVPWALGIPAVVAVAFLAVPLLALVVRAPWSSMPDLLTRAAALQALRLSLLTATAATGLSLLLGVPLAWVLARIPFRGVSVVRALVTVPLVAPPVVGGVALLLAFGRLGIVGESLDRCCGITLPFSTLGVVIAETFVAMPFLVISVEGALRSVGTDLDEAAATLGASGFHTFRRVTVPVLVPSLVAGSVLCWARALGEFGATITFAGNLPGVTQTMPLAVYRTFESDPQAAVALSLVLVGTSVGVLLVLRDRWVRPAW